MRPPILPLLFGCAALHRHDDLTCDLPLAGLTRPEYEGSD